MRRFVRYAVILAAFALGETQPAFGQDVAEHASRRVIDIAAHVAEAAQRFGIPEHWIYAVMRTESAGRIGAVSSAGAMGLMQLMPGTWERQRTRFGLGTDPFDPRDNIMAGTSYLREMYDSYGTPGFLAAYNAGPGRYQDWRDRGRPLPAETRSYVAKIAPMLQSGSGPTVVASAQILQADRISWTQSQLFAGRSDAVPDWSSDGAPAAPAPSLPHLPAPPDRQNGLFVAVSKKRPQ
ncbi:lytic transglycosylase domain-containing protein [Sphingorhabdus sp. IMCC26285]|uniref:Lytic transglycosylase domain-containing protein n=1 Tax=Sphingorhabdus profundilacus TaxID=2509718 RepID=A0A6I4M7Q6_9SPHN|nr:lytic transglycosylase domain-containing protein [Sphingorhabdus profundilacus]MVZ98125.1 lytic transglycosylase domain-containing protein [Sphingorhabdus profundilacus]